MAPCLCRRPPSRLPVVWPAAAGPVGRRPAGAAQVPAATGGDLQTNLTATLQYRRGESDTPQAVQQAALGGLSNTEGTAEGQLLGRYSMDGLILHCIVVLLIDMSP